MSDFVNIYDVLKDPKAVEDAYGIAAQLPTNRANPASSRGQSSYGATPADSISNWDWAFYYLGKPEEWASKTIGSLLSSDTKYSFGTGRPGDQTNFSDLFGDAFENTVGDRLPLLAAVLGISAAIVNPLDPLNKLKIAGLTRKGVALDRIAHLRNNAATRTLFKPNKKGIVQVDTSALKQQRKIAEDAVKTAKKPDDIAAAKQVINNLDRVEKEHKTLNQYLKEAQEEGLTFDEIRLAQDRHAQYAKGQRRMLGLTSPLKFDQLSLFRGHYDPFEGASNSVVSGGFKAGGLPLVAEVDAAISRGISTTGKAAKAILEAGGRVVTNTLGYNFVGPRFRPLVDRIDRALNSVSLDMRQKQMQILDAKRRAMQQGIPADQFDRYVKDYYAQRTEITDETASLLRGTLDNPPSDLAHILTGAAPSIERGAEKVKLVDPAALGGASAEYSPTSGARILAASEMSRAEAQDALTEWRTPSPNTRIGGRRGKLTSTHVMIERGDSFDPEIIDALRGVEGAVSYEVLDTVPKTIDPGSTPKYTLDDLERLYKEASKPTAAFANPEDAVAAVAELQKAQKYLLQHPRYGMEEVAKRAQKAAFQDKDIDYVKDLIRSEHWEDLGTGKFKDSPLKWLKIDHGQRDVRSTILAGKRPYGAKKGLDPIDPADKSGVVIDQNHIYNLEVLLAQLTRRGLVVGDLSASDFLFSDNGLVHLINPNIVEKSKKWAGGKPLKSIPDDIQHANRTRLKNFEARYGVGIPVDEPSAILDSKRAIVLTDTHAAKMQRIRRNLDEFPGEGKTFKYNAYNLLRQADNTAFHEQLLFNPDAVMEDVLKFQPQHEAMLIHEANSITDKMMEIQSAMAENRLPNLDPVEIAVDELGRLQIVRGRSDLVAAILSDMPEVNVKVHPITSVAQDIEQVFISQTQRLDDVFLSNPDEIAAAVLPERISRSYKINDNGKYRNVGPGNLKELEPNNLPTPPNKRLLNNVAHMFSQSPSGRFREIMFDKLMQAMKQSDTAELDVAEIILSVDNMADLQMQFNQKFGTNFYMDPDLLIPQHPKSAGFLDVLKDSAVGYLQGLARRGVFTDEMLNMPELTSLYTRGTIEAYDAQTKTLRFIRSSSTLDELDQYASKAINTKVQADDILPTYKIQLEAGDGVVQKSIVDYYQGDPHKLTEHLTFNRDLRVPADEIKRLNKSKIYVDPTPADLEAKGHLNEGRPIAKNEVASQSQGRPIYERSLHSFYLSDTGRLFVDTRSTKATNVAALLNQVFGEARIPRGEFGYIGTDRVTLHYPLADLTVLTPANFTILKYRLRATAKKLVDAGYNRNMKMSVITDMDEHVWNRMFKQDVTLGEMTGKNFDWIKLRDAKEGWDFTNVTRATGPDNVPLVYKMPKKHTSLNINPKYKLAVEFADRMDELRRSELLKDISTRFHAEYIPRVKTPDAERAMGVLKDQAYKRFNERHKGVKMIESFLLGRTLPDLTAPEINDFIKMLRKVEGDPNLNISKVMNELIHKGMATKDVKSLHWMAEMMDAAGLPRDAMFFYDDALFAEVRRTQKSGELMRKATILQTLKEEHAVFSIRANELTDYRKARKDIKALEDERDALIPQIQEIKQSIENARNSGTVGSNALADMQSTLGSLETRSGELQKKIGDGIEQLHQRYPSAQANAVDLDAPIVYIDSDVARSLIAQKKLEAGDIVTNLDYGLVPVPAAKVMKSMPDEAEIVMFPQEVMGVVERYFGSTNATTGRGKQVLNWLDGVTDAWRSWTLFPIPAYHLRNIISNGFLLWLGDLANIDSFNKARNLLGNIRNFNKQKTSYNEMIRMLDEAHIIDSFGNQVTARQLWGEAIKEGVFSGGLHFNEFSRGQMSVKKMGEFEELWHAMGALPASDLTSNFLLDNKLLRKGRNLGRSAEDVFRLAGFIEAWRKTGSFKEAGMQVKKIFYNYQDLSLFERRVLRRVLPFYSWSRFNIPRMIETMFTRPVTHYRIGEMFRNLERQANGGGPVDENSMPEWMQERFGIVVSKGEDGTYNIRTLDTLIPAYEAYGFFQNNFITEAASRIEQGFTPVLKLPLEAWFNKSLFTGRELEKHPGQPARGFLYSQLGMSRAPSTEGPLGLANLVLNEHFVRGSARPIDYVVNVFNNMLDDRTLTYAQPTFWAGLLDMALGKSYASDPVKTRAAIYRDWSRTQSALTNAYKYAVKQGDDVASEFFKGELNKFRLTKPPGVDR